MDVFELRKLLIGDYRRYVASFMAMRDRRIRERVQTSLDEGRLWPEPRIGLNPVFEAGGWIDDLVAEGLLHPGCADVFRVGKASSDAPLGTRMRLHRHQVDAIREARAGRNYVLTTGTGSGKSLAYLVPIVDAVLRSGSGGGVKAIVVYPMNALANSQAKELEKFLVAGAPGGQPPVTFQRYTGQEGDEARRAILEHPPDIILTNYVMLELILTRVRDRALIERAQGLRFLVLDELHTYRGRQGADVALLVRRLREACRAPDLRYVGTSATLSTEGSLRDQQEAVAAMATTIFGAPVAPTSVVGETLRRATPELDFSGAGTVDRLRQRLHEGPDPTTSSYDDFVADPLSSWIEQAFGVHQLEGRLVRVPPRPIGGTDGGAAQLAELPESIPTPRRWPSRRSSWPATRRVTPPPDSRPSPSACTSSSARATPSSLPWKRRRPATSPSTASASCPATATRCCCRCRSAASAARSTTRPGGCSTATASAASCPGSCASTRAKTPRRPASCT